MKLFPSSQTRQEYIETQIERSNEKFSYCKVSAHDVATYRSIILNDPGDTGKQGKIGPILCLGTRNGREIDLFRTEFFGARLLRYASRTLERNDLSFKSALPMLESQGRSDAQSISSTSVVGVEINPRATRCDVWVGSFDEMPADWEDKFGVVFSNSFDQSQDPHKTSQEWQRVMRAGGYLIFEFSEDTEPTSTDPVGNIRIEDTLRMFNGELVYFHSKGSRNKYSQVIIRLKAA